MQLKQLLTDDDAVSPVIGVILMVAITVILAAVIGAFVLGIGGDQSVAPQASWSVNEQPDDITFTHEGGDSIEADNLEMTATASILDSSDDRLPVTDLNLDTGDTVSAGTQIRDDNLDGEDNNGETIRIIWQDPGSDDSSVLRSHTLNNQDTT